MKTGAVVLAAGGSARLGQPKQLLTYQGQTLVRRAVEAALHGGCAPVLVVVGRDRSEVAAALENLPVEIVPNENWERGIGSSIRAGVGALPKLDAVVILACDQPHVESEVVRKLIETHTQSRRSIVANAYRGTIGIPALFAAEHFQKLLSLKDEEGAKSLLRAQPNDLATVDFPAGAIDIDTPEDVAGLSARRRKSA